MTAGAVSAPLIIPIIHPLTHRSKNHIDTNTPVSIQSDTPGVLIFYTLDGSKPVAVQRGSTCSSRKYSELILLPAGQVSVRAVAVFSDGRESSTVTKVFFVHSVNSDKTNVLQNNQQVTKHHSITSVTTVPPHSSLQHPPKGTSSSAENSAGSSLKVPELRMMGNGSPPSGPRFLNTRLGSAATAAPSGPAPSPQSVSPGPVRLSSTETSRIQRDTDFLRCAQCLSFRPSDPFARFCAQCGAVVPPLPAQRLPAAEGGQTVCCVFCDTVVPANAGTCLMCEASIPQQLQPQATRTLQGHVMCARCGTGNPAHVSSCLTCETRLQSSAHTQAGGWGRGAPPVPSAGSRMLTCSRCKRKNHSDARFCDWCGSKPGHAAPCVMCRRCGASGDPYAFYCTVCGIYLEAPAPPTSGSNTTRPGGASASHQVTPSSTHKVKVALPTDDQSTQTVGLYYPSATELHRKQQQSETQLSRQQNSKDRQPLLTAISPGRGYWRKQLDHVCAHLRSYAQNNPPFRTLLGEPRLGRMVSAVIQEDQYEVSLTISFVSAGREGKQVDAERDAAGPAGISPGPVGGVWRPETLSSVTEKSGGSSSARTDRSTPKPPARDVRLLKELGPGRGQISIIQQLLDEGADPSCQDSDGRHTLVVAVVNGHHDVLPVLVQRGADVDQQCGKMKNTALHEAAALGSEGLQCAQVLLRCKAGARRRNAAGQTPYDVAVNSGCSDMVSLLAAQTGPDLLGKL